MNICKTVVALLLSFTLFSTLIATPTRAGDASPTTQIHTPTAMEGPLVATTAPATTSPASSISSALTGESGMDPISIILIALFLVTAVSFVALKIDIPYPTAMVIGGLLIATAGVLFPKLGKLSIRLSPEVLFQLILPPLLYAAAWYTSWTEFWKYKRSIFLLATGCVLFTTFGMAGVAMALFPGFTWPAALAFGAIVSPPDAVAATAVTEHLRIPRRILTILDGESLINDATALVIVQFAIYAAQHGSFSLSAALIQFPIVAGGGVLIGMVVASIFHFIHTRVDGAAIETIMTLLTPYVAYQAGEHLHVSGVLATVTCGLVLSRHSHHLFSARTRLTAIALWDVLIFLLNGLAFILVGLQLPSILSLLKGSIAENLRFAAIACGAIIVLRILWCYPGAYLPRIIPSIRKSEPRPAGRQVFIVGWVGMRGVVSLAAALALPMTLDGTTPFPARNLILYLTFAIILFTLVGQSLTLPALIRALKLEVPQEQSCDESDARKLMLDAALSMLEKEELSPAVEHMRRVYIFKLDQFGECVLDPNGTESATLLRKSLAAQRHALLQLQATGHITDGLLSKLERELDLEESRW